MFSSYGYPLLNIFSLFIGSILYPSHCYKLTVSSKNESNLTYISGNINSTLEITCRLENFNNDSDLTINWHLPESNESGPDAEVTEFWDSARLTLTKLTEKHRGRYLCQATVGQEVVNTTVYVHVKPKPCSNLFECSPQSNICIHRRYLCDGFNDCESGDDESPLLCGGDACLGKIRCSDGRCIPAHWCCDQWEPNCTARLRHSCCPSLPPDRDDFSFYHNVRTNQHYTDATFLQSTIYTIVGFTMVFMSIVTILMIAICRVHLQRSIVSSVPRRQVSVSLLTQLARSPSSPQRVQADEESSRMSVSYRMMSRSACLAPPPPYTEVSLPNDPPPSYAAIFNTRTVTEGAEDCETEPCLNPTKPSL